MIRFEDLLEKVRAYSPDADVELLRRAYVFSAFEHRGQVRHSGEPYLIHPLAVADFLADMKLDAVAIAAGLLHDVVEDTLTTIERIKELFGPEVAHVVEGVTKISAIPFSSSEERQAENFRKMLLAMVDDIRVILVKLADRLHNMRTLSHLSEERRIKIAQETRDIYAPIANRLGMSKVKNELEELSFRYLEPQAYEALRISVDAKRRATEGLIEQLKTTIAGKLAEAQVPGRRDRRSHQAAVEHPSEARTSEDRAGAGVRLHRAPHHHRGRQGLLRGARHHPPDLVAGARTDQGLHRHAAAQRLSVAPHVGDQPRRHAVRGADPHDRDAPEGGRGHCGALEIQGRPRRRPAGRALFPVDAGAARVSAGGARSPGVHPEPEDRPLSGGGLHLHAKGPGQGLSAGRHADRFRVLDSYRRRPAVRRRAHQRQDGAAPLAAQERRHRRDHHVGRPQTEPRLAQLRGDLARAVRDQAFHPRRGEGARPRSRPQGVREGGAALRPQPQDPRRQRGLQARSGRLRGPEAGRCLCGDRLWEALAQAGAGQAGAG